jgi:hypothetical protein
MAVLETIALELKSIRYLINNLLTTMMDIRALLSLLLAKNKITKEEIKKKRKEVVVKDGVKFDLFELSTSQYNGLVDSYGYDTVCRAASMLDDFIRDKGYCPYGKPVLALKKVMLLHALKEKLESRDGKAITKIIDPTLIETKEEAIEFIQSVPSYKRNIDPIVIDLKERFSIND